MSTKKTAVNKLKDVDLFVIKQELSEIEKSAKRDLERPEAGQPDARGAFILKERAEASLEVVRRVRAVLEDR